ncbi:hypothetical protein [Vermiculatibacterium agrestimuris]|uniref:hypothetical protein n=1 Tax=Vermiculatibacterium agrestimuris TaxID=2941519 RepID=UPI00203C6B5F|nr:hypothetical protein [Vermiculatibacterium agrestimuris]
MNLIHEQYAILTALVPQSIAAAGSAQGGAIDLQGRHSFCVAVQLGAVAADKSVTVELSTGNAADGTDGKTLDSVTYTAPTGGVTDHVVELSGLVRPTMGRYLKVKVTNNGAAAVLSGAAVILDCGHYPEDTGATVKVVGAAANNQPAG